MKTGLLLNSNNRLSSQSALYRKILENNYLDYKIIDPNSLSLIEDLKECTHLLFQHTQGDTDGLIYDSIYNIACNVLNINCYPNYQTYWPYENKIKEYYLLKSNDFPVIPTRVFWNFEHAEKYLGEVKYPIICKLPKGAGSSNVVLIESYKSGKKIINQVFGRGAKTHKMKSKSNLLSLSKIGWYNYGKILLKTQLLSIGLLKEKNEYPEWQIQKDAILFQKYLPGNTFDTRVTVIGKRAFAFRRFVREDDFRASGSGKIDVGSNKIDKRCLEIAFDVCRKINFNCMAFDFIFDEEKNPKISEISYCFVDYFLFDCPGYWDDNLNWHEGHFWPQQFQLEDFLGINLNHYVNNADNV